PAHPQGRAGGGARGTAAGAGPARGGSPKEADRPGGRRQEPPGPAPQAGRDLRRARHRRGRAGGGRRRAAVIDAVVIRGLTKRFGTQRVLAGVDLELRAGRLCALLGPNGAGKSTLLGILSTLVRPTAGEVSFRAGDRALGGGGELRRIIGVLAHDSFL